MCTNTQRAWDGLGETAPYNPTEALRISADQANLMEQAEAIAAKAKQYNHIANLQKELELKSKALSDAEAELANLRDKQTELGYNVEADQHA